MKAEAERSLLDVKPEHHFHVKDGAVIKNLYELHDKLLDMDDSTFQHHVREDGNDFKNWVNDVLNDEPLAEELAKRRSRKAMIEAIDKRLKSLETLKQKKGCEHRIHINCGVRDFLVGIALGILIGLMIARLLV